MLSRLFVVLGVYVVALAGCGGGRSGEDGNGDAAMSAECGNGIVEDGEGCDDGNGSNDDGCLTACGEVGDCCQLNVCGDGYVDRTEVVVGGQPVEGCDDGEGNSDTTPNACRMNCQLPFCGDGVVDDGAAGEVCDDGEGNSDTVPGACRTRCVPGGCGDGILEPGEECDDGNDSSNDGCSSECESEGPSWRRVAGVFDERAGHSLAYDSSRDRVVLFGGHTFLTNVLGDTWEYDGDRWVEVEMGMEMAASPPARLGHVMAYDAARQRVVMFGGSNGLLEPIADTWEYDGFEWVEVITSATPIPCPRLAMAYDVDRQVMVLHASVDGTGLAETWEYDGFDWTPVVTMMEPPTGEVDMVYDQQRQRMVLSTAWYNLGVYYFETWEFDGADWSAVITSNVPPGTLRHAMTYDTAHQRTTLLRGRAGSGYGPGGAETWVYDGTDWAHLSTGHGPVERAEHAAVFRSANQSIVMHGGVLQSHYLDDTWELDGTQCRAPDIPFFFFRLAAVG